MLRFIKMLGGALLAGTLAACGGGGGSPGTTTGAPTTPVPTTGTPTLTLSIVDASGQAASSVTAGGAFSARATVRSGSGATVANRLVTFSLSDANIATLTPATALTDANGTAQIGISPSSINAVGAATLTATASVDNTTVTGSRDFAVAASNISLTNLTVGSSSLPSGGNTPVSVQVLVGGQPPANGLPVNVTFTASCGRINGTGSSFGATTNGSGVASATYTAVSASGDLCSGPVTLTATSAGATPASATLNVASAVANAITFVSATPQQIFVAGSGALEQSVVRFRVLSGTTPLANMPVRFSVVTNPGGVGLNAAGNTAEVTGTTDAAGDVTVSVFSGSIPGPVRVRASLVSNPNVFAETQNLTVASGPPSQRFMSLSVSTTNIEGFNRDGTATTLTVRLADRQGNPVEDGTVVNFTAEGGQVAPSCATTRTNGISSCSVDFISQNPRPAGGRVSVLAFASGTKDYVDVNGNNRYDASVDTLVNIGDAFRDDNENGSFDAGEFVIPRGGAATCAGSGGAFPSRANTCDTQLGTTVRQQAVILFSSSSAAFLNLTATASEVSFALASADNLGLPMPAGTTVLADTGDTTENQQACAIDKILPASVPNAVTTPTQHTITLKGCVAGDLLNIRIRAPSGTETSRLVRL